jgi:hypothetical protein
MEEESAADAESKDKVRVDVDAKPGLNRFKLAALRVMRENAVAKRLAMFKALRATDMTSSYAAEYTGSVEAKTVAFHRRLERGAGLELCDLRPETLSIMSSESPKRTSDSSRRPSVEEKQSGAEVAPEDEYVELGEMEEESAADAESKDKVRVDVDAKPGLNRFKLAALRVMRENAVAKRLAMFKALRATDMTSSYAAEYTGSVEAKTVAFHRRLERGAGLELFYTKGKHLPGSYANVKGKATSVGDARLRVVMHAGHGLVWWRGHKFGPVKAFHTRGITHCFAIEDILQVGLVQGDKKGSSFFVKLKKPASVVTWHGGRHVKESETFEPFSLVFSTQTRATASIFMGGFELLRRHHTQLFHKDDEVDEADTYSLAPSATPSGLSEEPTLVETATASLRAAVGLKPRKSLVVNGKIKATDLESSKKASFAGAAPLGAASIHAFTQGGVPAGTARRASDAKAVPTHVLPSHFSIVSSFFEPHRDPTHQHYHQDIQARIVEVYYEAFVEDSDLDLLQQPKIRLPNGNRFRLPTEHFCEGVWCTATVCVEIKSSTRLQCARIRMF